MFNLWVENNFEFNTINNGNWISSAVAETFYVELESKPAYVFRDDNFLYEVSNLPVGIETWYWGNLDGLQSNALYMRQPYNVQYASFKDIIVNDGTKVIYTTKVNIRNKSSDICLVKMVVDDALILDDYIIDNYELEITDKIPVTNKLKIASSTEDLEVIVYGIYK